MHCHLHSSRNDNGMVTVNQKGAARWHERFIILSLKRIQTKIKSFKWETLTVSLSYCPHFSEFNQQKKNEKIKHFQQCRGKALLENQSRRSHPALCQHFVPPYKAKCMTVFIVT